MPAFVPRCVVFWKRTALGLFLFGAACLMGPSHALGQALYLEGGPPRLQIDRFEPGSPTATATDASSSLVYGRSRTSNRQLKVVVSASAFNEQFKLEVRAMNPTAGTSQGWVRLRDGMPAADLLRNIDPCRASGSGRRACRERARLRYRMTADVEDGPGRQEHVVRYTLLVQ